MLTTGAGPGGLSPGAQLVLWLGTFRVELGGRIVHNVAAFRRTEHAERWGGDRRFDETAQRLKAYKRCSLTPGSFSTVGRRRAGIGYHTAAIGASNRR